MNNNRESYTFAQAEREKTVNDIAEYLGKLMRRHLDECTRCCPNCDYFGGGKTEICELAGVRPPASIIAFGCEKYVDRIPF